MAQATTTKLTRLMQGVLARFDYDGLLGLVIEPDDDNRAALVRTLSELGLPLPLEAATAADALYAAEELVPAFILLDARLQGPDGTDGLELLQRIREDATTLPADIPVILLAGSAGDFTVHEAKRLGVDALLIKPVPAKRLQNRVNGLLMRRFADRVTWGS